VEGRAEIWFRVRLGPPSRRERGTSPPSPPHHAPALGVPVARGATPPRPHLSYQGTPARALSVRFNCSVLARAMQDPCQGWAACNLHASRAPCKGRATALPSPWPGAPVLPGFAWGVWAKNSEMKLVASTPKNSDARKPRPTYVPVIPPASDTPLQTSLSSQALASAGHTQAKPRPLIPPIPAPAFTSHLTPCVPRPLKPKSGRGGKAPGSTA
jgi:hypothetical protein